MDWLAANGATIAVLLVVVVCVALAVRSLRSGAVSCEDCNGECGGCATGCATPKLELSLAQQEKLRLLKAKEAHNG